MIGSRYWTTGIELRWYDDPTKPWSVKLDFLDDGFCDTDSTEGTLRLRYSIGDLSDAIDTLIKDAKALGIEFKYPTIYMVCDGEPGVDPFGDPYVYPEGWRRIINDECDRLGWRSLYKPHWMQNT